MPAVFTIPSIFTAVDKFTGPVKKMQQATSAFSARSAVALARVERGFRSLMSPLAGLRNAMNNIGFYVGIYTFIRVLRDAFNTIADFEQGQINLAAVTHKSVKENEKFTYQARDMAIKYGTAADKVEALQFELTKLGLVDVLGTVEAAFVGAKGLGYNDPFDFGQTLGLAMKAYTDRQGNPLVGVDGKPLIGTAMQLADAMVKLADVSAISGEHFNTMFANSITAAKEAKIPILDLLAMFALAKDDLLNTGSAGTAAKNIIFTNALKMPSGVDANEYLAQQMDIMMKNPNVLKAAVKRYQRKAAQTALSIGRGIDEGTFGQYVKAMQKAGQQGYAMERNATQMKSLRNNANQLSTAYDELMISLNDGTSPLAESLKYWLQVGRAVLLMASSSQVATDNLKMMSPEVNESAQTIYKWLKIIKWTAIVLGGLWLAIKLATAGLFLWNTVGWLGIYMGKAMVWLLASQTAATGAATASQWSLNAAMAANPIGVIIVAITALIILVYQMVKHWDEWGAAISVLLGPLGMVVSLLVSFYRHWDLITKSFSDGGVLAGFRAIARVILDSILYPMQKIFEMIHAVTGMTVYSDMAKAAEFYRKAIGFGNSDEESKPKEKVKTADTSNVLGDFYKQILDGKLKIEILDKGGNVGRVVKDSTNIMPVVVGNQSMFGRGLNDY